MSDTNAYYAEPARIHAGVRQIDQISTLAQDMLRDFVSAVNLTSDWPGTNDSYAKEAIPQEKKEREAALGTGQALTDSVVGVANGTTTNLSSILSTQSGVLDAIHNSAPGSSGKH
jgi:hypothetical protein